MLVCVKPIYFEASAGLAMCHFQQWPFFVAVFSDFNSQTMQTTQTMQTWFAVCNKLCKPGLRFATNLVCGLLLVRGGNNKPKKGAKNCLMRVYLQKTSVCKIFFSNFSFYSNKLLLLLNLLSLLRWL